MLVTPQQSKSTMPKQKDEEPAQHSFKYICVYIYIYIYI